MSSGSAPHYFLESERLGFRPWGEGDLDLAVELWGDPRVARWIASEALTREDVAERLAREREMEMDHGIQYWPIFLKADGTFVGCCGLRPRHPAARIMELGFHLCSRHWGQGYAIEAARAVIGLAWSRLEAVALFAGHHPENQRSRELLLKLGFNQTHEERYPPTGLEHPAYLLPRPER